MSDVLLAATEALTEETTRLLWERGNLSWKLWPQQLPIYNTVRKLPRNVQTVVFLCARQYGKCMAYHTLVSTPKGPVEIQDLHIGHEIYGYNSDGSIGITKVVAKENVGVKTVHKLVSHNRHVVSATKEHRFLSSWVDNKHAPKKFAELTTHQILNTNRRKIVRSLIDAPLGDVHCDHAYAIGAMIGNGCCREGGTQIYISAPDGLVPRRVADIVGAEFCYKAHKDNFTWVLSSTPKGPKGINSSKVVIEHEDWFKDKYSHEKSLDRGVIETWDRASCLALLAGLTDTDGSCLLQKDGTLRWNYSTGSSQLAKDVQWLVYRLFQREPGITHFHRRESNEYTIHISNNLHVSRLLKQISPYMVVEHKKWLAEYEGVSFRNTLQDQIGVKDGGTYETECYDIQVDNDTNLYVLHNEGLVTHNSVLVTTLAVEDCLQNPDVVVMIIGPSIKQTRAIVRPRIKLIGKDAPIGMIKHVKYEDAWYFPNGSELRLGGFDTNSGGQRGKTVFKIYLEETGESRGDDYIDFLRSDLAPTLTHSAHAQVIHATTLPKIPDHPFSLETVPEAEMSGALFTFTIRDNKKLSQDKYDQCVKICGGEHTTAFRREYLCEQVRDESMILAPEFDEKLHVKECTAPEYAFFWTSGDTGIVRDLNVFHLWCYDFKRAKKLVLDERWFPPSVGTGEMVALILEMEGGRQVSRHIDTDARLRLDLSGQHKFATMLPQKDELEATVNLVRVELQTGSVEIDPKCKLLITTLRSGTFNNMRTDLARTLTLGHMDAFMSFAYGLRHTNMSNPYPLYGDATPYSHYISTQNKKSLVSGFQKMLGA